MVASSPRAPVAAPLTEAVTESIPVKRRYPPRQSRIGRLIGRWTTGGHFQSRSRMGDATHLEDPPYGDRDGHHDSDIDLPRDTTGRNVILVLAIAVLTFMVTFAIVKLRQSLSSKPEDTRAQMVDTKPAPPPPTPAVVPPAPQPVAAQPQPVAARLQPSATPAPLGKTALLGLPSPKAPPRPGKAARANNTAPQLPEHLRGELLPLTP